MAKKLLIRTPMTTDGKMLAYDDNRQPIFSESLVEDNKVVRQQFEALNASLPEAFRFEMKVIDVDDETGLPIKAKAAVKAPEPEETDDDLAGEIPKKNLGGRPPKDGKK